ncbi:hypothetical protein DL769_005725 [Monosporascus sp. CRB-8-3]|nr:hypothetical protein DL769_005725 [Monosporascus sp. CRB-8-3]
MVATVSLNNVAFWMPPAAAGSARAGQANQQSQFPSNPEHLPPRSDKQRDHISVLPVPMTNGPIWIQSDAESRSDMDDTDVDDGCGTASNCAKETFDYDFDDRAGNVHRQGTSVDDRHGQKAAADVEPPRSLSPERSSIQPMSPLISRANEAAVDRAATQADHVGSRPMGSTAAIAGNARNTLENFSSEPPTGLSTLDSGLFSCDAIRQNLVFLGFLPVQNRLQENAPRTVYQFRRAGVVVCMVSDDNANAAKAIATECGILTPHGIFLEGGVFQSLDDERVVEILPRLQVLVRASPSDKRRLVSKLKELGKVVAFTGDGPGDMAALRVADVQVSKGIRASAMVTESSSIVLTDSSLGSTLKALMRGRSLNDSVKKAIHFQVPAQMSSILLALITAMLDLDFRPLLSPVQMLWL